MGRFVASFRFVTDIRFFEYIPALEPVCDLCIPARSLDGVPWRGEQDIGRLRHCLCLLYHQKGTRVEDLGTLKAIKPFASLSPPLPTQCLC